MLMQIVDDVRRYLEECGSPARVLEGAAARDGQDFDALTGGRVVFMASPKVQIGEPEFIGDEPRQLATAILSLDVAVAGFSASYPERDFAHRAVCIDLLELVMQAAQRSYWGAHAWGGATWTDPRKLGRHGAELIATLAIRLPIHDRADVRVSPRPRPNEPKPAP